MAGMFLGSVVDSITGHVVSLVSQSLGVSSELESLRMTISATGALLREADKRQVNSEVVKDWLEKLKDVIYDADDLLDDFSTEALRRQRARVGVKRVWDEVSAFFTPSNHVFYAVKMALPVMKIKKRIDAITNDRIRFELEGTSSGCPMGSLVENRVRPETYPFESQPYVIGRDKDKRGVMEFLLNPDYGENFILAIVGLGGLGKTTLARLVFDDERVKKNFALRFWVCVSTNFNVEDILRMILREDIPKKELANLDMNELQEKLENVLEGKRFLLVLDDMWNENRREWLKLQGYLRNGAKGSKILATTRNLRVAKTITKTFYELSGLPEPESLSLLMRMAMKEEHEWKSQNLEMIAKEILKKCAGVPLAITTIGRLLLFSRNTEEDWLNFNNNDLSRVHQEEGDIMPSLKLSYDILPPHLKLCFAYCCVFPKDYKLEPSELVHLWMAQGFIKSLGSRKTPEEIGHDYFMELLWRSFFQDIKEDKYGNIIGCKMHDLMHDLAQSVAGDDCISIDITDTKEIPQGARHVSIIGVEDDEFKGIERDRRLRSLLFAIEKRKGAGISSLDVSCFRNLRALRLHAIGIRVISHSIGELKHLRSLDLSLNYHLRYLPNSISSLCNLESLNLRECWELEILPRGLTKLVNLRHLDVRECHSLIHMPRGIGKLTTLHTLGLFIVGERGNQDAARLNELSTLTRLRNELTIQKLERLGSILDEVDVSFSLKKIPLQSLELKWRYAKVKYRPNDEEVLERFRLHANLKGLKIEGYSGARISSWVSQICKLMEIQIINCYKCRHLPPLDHLRFLKRIALRGLSDLEWIELSNGGTPESFFPSLEELKLEDLYKFRGWGRRHNTEGLEKGTLAEEEGSLLMLITALSNKISVNIIGCPRFSYLLCERLQLGGTMNKPLQQLLKPVPTSLMVTMTNEDFLSAVTSLTINNMEAEHLPMELYRSLPLLRSLVIIDCPRLEVVCVREIVRCLTALQRLEILKCDKLDLSMDKVDDDGSNKGMHNLQLQGHKELRHLFIHKIQKMESLPRLIQYFPNLESLVISNLTCWSEDPKDMPSLRFSGSTKLKQLEIYGNRKMETLPWWIRHLTNLEYLRLQECSNLKALPEWFPQLTSLKTLRVICCGELGRRCWRNTGEDLPKISHI